LNPSVDLVIPSAGRASLGRLLGALAANQLLPGAIFVVFDARAHGARLPAAVPPRVAARLGVLRAPRPGPAAARNMGWRVARSEWVAFLDDDVLPPPEWAGALAADLARLGADVAASQGRVRVPLDRSRPPTDWERNVRGLESARYATADIAYRLRALEEVGGFDERFARAYREDSDLALRVLRAGWRIDFGERSVAHPVGPAGFWQSVVLQAGNADDVLMRVLHGRGWRTACGAERGGRPRHLGVVVAGVGGLAALAAGRGGLARLGLGAWALGTAELARARIAPGPGDALEVARMVITSVAIPPAAAWHWLRGWPRALRLARGPARDARPPRGASSRPASARGPFSTHVPRSSGPATTSAPRRTYARSP
jgi:hypothetical protein